MKKKNAVAIKPAAKVVEPKNVGGRPTKYEPRFCEELIDHMALGYSFESFAAIAKCDRSILYDWEKAHPEFKSAKEQAFAEGLLFWERLGIDNIISTNDFSRDGDSQQSSSKTLNGSVWIFNMKNRFRWRDKQADENDTLNVNVHLADRMAKARARVGSGEK